MRDLPFRQVHLDFHTSALIPGIGAAFDPERYADTLARAQVNSVTTFARCHHGMIYYDTAVHPERIHPHLARPDFLKEQIAACHARGIRVPIYTTVQWDQFVIQHHPEWLCTDETGRIINHHPFEPGFYAYCDVLHPGYRQFLEDHVRDLFASLPVDGLFFDIVQPRWSCAPHWLQAMADAGIDPENAAAREIFGCTVINEWKQSMTRFIQSLPQYDPEQCTIFYNAGHIGPRHRATRDAYTHYEVESLPSGGWGYLHFPLTQRYVRGLEKQTLGMTGKFHTAWGDFHSYKNPPALRYECLSMLALGARCSVGDQLHPGGELDAGTYELIGGVYAEVAQKEPWCVGTEAVVEAAVLTPEQFQHEPGSFNAAAEAQPVAALGAVRLLQEIGLQFDVIDTGADFTRYRLLVLPDQIPVNAALQERLEAFVAAGGRLIATGHSGLRPGGTQGFAGDLWGVTARGEAPFSPDYLVPGPGLKTEHAGDLRIGAPHVMYLRGVEVTAAPGAEVLAEVQRPYFNRTWQHYSSHRHTPSSGEIAYPGIVQKGGVIYFAHPIFRQYHDNAPRWCKQLLAAAIDRLLPQRVLQVTSPSGLTTAVNDQPAENRRVVHLLYFVPERRGKTFDIIEDTLPLHDLKVSVAVDRPVSAVRVVPEGRALAFEAIDGAVQFSLPRLEGHAMIELQWQ